ncbi:hypothetical protein [Mycobacterium sp. 3519A]|uniref:hypothetical protein n=1 Tax=Mycobacterium sp. 3519A TaxID=2057184 RepID=UPI000C7DDAA8|nr:hypothetical protein [Mycobacterium sp. 3519A]
MLTVAGSTGTGDSVGVGIAADGAVDVAIGSSVASVGATTGRVGRAGWSRTTTVAAAAASVARTTPVRTIRRDQRPSSAGCGKAEVAASSPSPADSSASSGSNR